ncbi:YybS family protein [Neobacillus ginsengisoli]|uniref:Uncharacterized protein YybS (DUF2232 family) n=1 Tax=Neobacillus ginsengisoli TaxID=904295 RepID=A0ABT9XZK6_9BACI|nr:YybS family protein [Neobacillus ginsengisoli]MDQ0201006.1 uncharacterized protein YybS (DUF2232 family) [Neobacillus ginsengisoli]
MKNIRKLTEGAILLAVFSVLLLITFYIPVIGMVINLFLPVPFMLFAAKNDWKSTAVFVIASLLLSFLVGSILSLPITIPYGLTGAVMGMLIQKRKNSITIFISGSLVFLANFIVIYIVSIYFFHVDMIQQMIDLVRSSMNMSADMVKKMGQPGDYKKMLDQMNSGLNLVKTLIPTLFVITSFFAVMIIQVVSFPILKRFGVKYENLKAFRDISLPRSLLWYYLFTMAASLLVHPQVGTYWHSALLNLTYILFFLMVIQGFSLLFFFFHQRGMAKSASIPIAIISFVIPFLLYIVGILGIMDLGFDLRKRFVKKE